MNETAEKETTTTTNASSCERCGGNFFCDAGAEKCWCYEIPLSEAAAARLRENFERCLCEKCLSRVSRARADAD